MGSDVARRIAEGARTEHDVPGDAEFAEATRQYIEVLAGPSSEPGPVRDVLVWLVRFDFRASWVTLAVSEDSGEIVRVAWSR